MPAQAEKDQAKAVFVRSSNWMKNSSGSLSSKVGTRRGSCLLQASPEEHFPSIVPTETLSVSSPFPPSVPPSLPSRLHSYVVLLSTALRQSPPTIFIRLIFQLLHLRFLWFVYYFDFIAKHPCVKESCKPATFGSAINLSKSKAAGGLHDIQLPPLRNVFSIVKMK